MMDRPDAPQPVTKKWVGWFRPLARAQRQGPLLATPIEIVEWADSQRSELAPVLVISVPAACGNAVRRNRFRRMTKAYFVKRMAAKKLSVTVRKENPTTDLRDSTSCDVSHELLTASRKSQKATPQSLWIRLLNRHKLGTKIRLDDWRRDFDSLAQKAGW